nr:hypothetical protein BaRGS_028710 [Batillaria attramentaria]
MEESQESADSEAWKEAVNKITQLKDEYLAAKQQLDTGHLLELQQKVKARRKKRERMKRQKQEKREAEEQALFERAQKHAAIDKWRDQIQQEHLRQKQIKEMKETADKTLGKVRREIREARKMLDTLSGLQKLRTIRTDTAARRGQTFPGDVAEHFTEKTDDLMRLLSQQLEAYEKEEAALKQAAEYGNMQTGSRVTVRFTSVRLATLNRSNYLITQIFGQIIPSIV